MADGKVVISTKLDNTGFEEGLAGLQGSIKKFAGVLGLAFGVGAIIAFGKKAIDLASDVAEVQNVVDTAFGTMAYKMEAFANTAIETAGMSKLAAKQMGSTFMAMSVGMGQAVEQGSGLAVDMTQRMGDLMSFYNKTLSEAETIGRAVYSGETEPLKQIGVIMNQNTLELFAMQNGYKQLYKNMSAADQLFVRQQFFLKATNMAAGDFVKTQDSWANQSRILSERCKELASVLGNSLITVLTPALQLVNSMVGAMLKLAKTFNAVITAIFGSAGKQMGETQKQSEAVGGAINGSVANQEDLTDETKKTGKAAKGSLGTFDELNVLQQTTASAGADTGVGAGGAAPPEMTPPDTEELPSVIEAMVARVQALLAPLQAINFDNLAIAFGRLQEAIAPLGQALFVGLEWAYTNLLVPLAQWTVEDVVPAFLTTLAAAFDVLTAALTALEPFGTWMWETFLQPLGQWAGERIVALLEALQKDFEAMGQWIGENATIFESFVILLGAFVTAFTLMTVAMGLFNAVCLIGDAAIWGIGKAMAFLAANPIILVVAAIAAVIAIIVLLIKNWDTVKEVGKRCVNAVLACWGVVAAWFDTNVIQPVASMFAALWEGVSAIFMTVWDTLSDAFKWYINGWLTLIENFANFFIRMINTIIDGLNMISFDIPDWVPGIGGKSFGISIPNIPELRLPRLATGAVIPANREFMAVLGDQKHGTNIEAPADLIRQIVREESGGQEITIRFEGTMAQFVRMLKPELDREQRRRGTRLVTGGI